MTLFFVILLVVVFLGSTQGATWQVAKEIGYSGSTTTGSDGDLTPQVARGMIKSNATHSNTVIRATQYVGDGANIYFTQPTVELDQYESDIYIGGTTAPLQSSSWLVTSVIVHGDAGGTATYAITFPWNP